MEVDRCGLRHVNPGPALREDLEHAAAVFAAPNLLDRLPLVDRGARVDVQRADAVPFMDRLRPRHPFRKRDPIQSCRTEISFSDVVGDKGLAVPVSRMAVEVARTPVVAVAALDVLRLEIPLCCQRVPQPGNGAPGIMLMERPEP